MSIYTEQGYKDRQDYLQALSEEFEIDIDTVVALASVLGAGEDFDGLVTMLQDYEEDF